MRNLIQSSSELKLHQSFLGKPYFYEIHFKNIGGLVMPLIVEFAFADGTAEVQRIPAEISRLDSKNVSRIFITEKEATKIVLDPSLKLPIPMSPTTIGSIYHHHRDMICLGRK